MIYKPHCSNEIWLLKKRGTSGRRQKSSLRHWGGVGEVLIEALWRFRKGVEKVYGRHLEGVGKVSGKHWAGFWEGI